MQQRMVHGAMLDFATPDEIYHLIPRPEQVTRIRAGETIQLDANGAGRDEVYKVPLGYEFAARRVSVTLSGVSDPSSGNVVLNVAGKWIAYLRSQQFIEFGQPQYGAAIQVPGIQTWGDQQGPYLRNGEYFEVQAAGLTANAALIVLLEGLLVRPSTERHA